MSKIEILEEIRRTAKENGGKPLGHKRFAQQTGIEYYDWWGKYWGRWNDALQEAGLAPNSLQGPIDNDVLIEKLIVLIRELGRFPVGGDLRLRKRSDPSFPNSKVFETHFGSRSRLRKAVTEYCQSRGGFDDVLPLCVESRPKHDLNGEADDEKQLDQVGCVYLMKHGRYYKIGKTNAAGRREYELAIQMPEKLSTVHIIKTDDPTGIEEYWHKRFAQKRSNGEWFELDPADIRVFKRRKFM